VFFYNSLHTELVEREYFTKSALCHSSILCCTCLCCLFIQKCIRSYNVCLNCPLTKLNFHPSNYSSAKIRPLPPPFWFLIHTELDTRQDSSGRVISPSQRPLHTHDNTTYSYKHKRQTSMLSAGFEPVIPETKRPHTNSLDRAATAIDQTEFSLLQMKH
jgi:hypothetical protein